MIKRRHIALFLLLSFIFGEELYFEDFGSGSWPAGYTYDGNWMISDSWEGNDTPPAAVYNWTPRQTDFEHHLTTSSIDVSGNSGVLVQFDFALDFYQQDKLNGLRIAYNGGGDWTNVLEYAIGPDAGDVDVSRRTESFTADIEEGANLQVRWTAFGEDSWAINGWIVDNLRILTLPQLTSVTIESLNEDPTTATAGSYIDLLFTTDSDLAGEPFVQMNGNSTELYYLENRTWQARYTVLETDPDGPLEFTIDFTDVNGVSGQTVKTTTNGSSVIVDNSAPPSFTVGPVTSSGGNVFSELWNTTNTDIQLEVAVPQDSAVASFTYTQGNSLLFDGVDDVVNNPGSANYQFSDAFTVEVWVKPTSASDYEGIISYGQDNGIGSQSGFGFVFYATGWRFFLKTTSNSINYADMAETSTPVGQWTHLAATYNGQHVKVYRNGFMIDSTDVIDNVEWAGVGSNLVVGGFTKDGTTKYFDGNIDEVRLWNYTRSAAQIKASKELTFTGTETGLVGYWTIDEGSGTTTADLTSNANTGSISGATWAIENSPIEFKTPNYDTGVIVGSAFQLRGRVGTNNFELFGEKDTITTADFNVGTKIVSSSETGFEAIVDFAHGETAQLSAHLYDLAGNYSLGDTSTTNTVIDLVADAPSPVSITSNNTFSHLAKTGDQVTITMTYSEDVETPDITIDGNDADDVSDLGGEQFSSSYTLTGSESEGSLPFTINTTDYLGNSGTHLESTDGSTVVYDKTIPTLSPVSIASNNADTTWAKANDSISVTFTSSERISADFALSFDGDDDYIELPDGMVSSLNDFTFICWFKTDVNDPWTRLIDFGSSTAVNMFLTPSYSGTNIPRFAIKQSGGGEQQITSSSPLNQGQWYHIAVTIDHNTNTGKMYLDGTLIAENNSMTIRPSSLGNTTNNYFGKSQYNDPYLDGMMDDISIWDRTLDQNEIQSSMYTSLNGDENGLISYWGLNEGSGGTTYDKSSNTNDGVLNNMDPTSAWLFQRGSIITATIMSQDASISTINSDQFRADYTTTFTDPEGEVQFGVLFADLAGNDGETVTSTTNNSRVIFDRTAPADFTVGIVTATGGNVVTNVWNSTNIGLNVNVPIASDTTLKNGTVQLLAKIGSNAFTAIGSVSTITNSDLGSDKLMSLDSAAVEALSGFAEEDSIYIKAVISDRPGNTKEGTESLNKLVIDQTPPSISNIHIESNNVFDTTKAKVNDIITLTFLADETLQTPSSTISESVATVTDLGSFQWSSTFTMTELNDEGIIPFTIDSLKDARGNPLDNISTTSDGSSILFDRTKPTLNQVNLESNNSNNNQWAKVGDYGRIYTNSSEALRSLSATIAENTTTNHWYSASEFELGHTFLETDNEGVVPIQIVFSDSVGNVGDTVTATLDDSQIIFDKTLPTDFTVGNVIATSGNVVEYYWNSTNMGLDILVPIDNDSTLENGKAKIDLKIGDNDFETKNISVIDPADIGTNKTISITRDSLESVTGYEEGDTIITIRAQLIDIPGNETIGSQSSTQLVIEETPPTLTHISYKSDFSDTTLATIGNTITVTFKTSEESQAPLVTISENNATVSYQTNNTWTAVYSMVESDNEGIIPFVIDTITDVRGNPSASPFQESTDMSFVIFDKTAPELSFVNIASNNVDTIWAKVGDTITVEFIGNELLTDQSATIVTQTAAITSTGFANFYSLSFDGIDDEVKITGSGFISGNEPRSISVWADGSSGNIVSLGDGAGTTNQRFSILISNERRVLIIGESNDWHTNYYLPQNQMTHLVVTHDGSTVKLYANGVFQDQTSKTYNTDSSMPIMIGTNTDDRDSEYFNGIIDIVIITRDALSIGEVSALYNGSDVALDNLIAKFNFNEGSGSVAYDQSGNGNNGTIYGAVWTTEGASNTKKYYAKYVMEETDPEGEVPFEIVVIDSVGLVSDPVIQTTDESSVIFDRTAPTLSYVHIESNNSNNSSIAITGDIVTMTFTPVEPLLSDSMLVTIAGDTMALTQDGDNYVATLTIDGDEPGGVIMYTIDFMDRAGNAGIQVSSSTDDSYVNHDIVPPEILSVSIFSNNSDTTWAKSGDTVFVKFISNEALDNLNITISGASSGYLEDGVANYRGYRIMDETDSEGEVSFNIAFTDLGGVVGPEADTTTDQSTVRYDRTAPVLSAIRMASNNAIADSLAALGDIDSIFFTTDEIQRSVSVILHDSSIVPDQTGLNFIATREFSSQDSDGFITFTVSLEDSAGNSSGEISETSDGSRVRFDGTKPTLTAVSFNSTNDVDASLAIVTDTLILDFTSDETLNSSTVQIAGLTADTTFENSGRTPFRSWRVMDGTETEGTIPFQITYYDLVGNMGDVIDSSTDETSILFDMTAPAAFALDTVYTTGGVVTNGYWNSSNDSIAIVVPIPSDDETLIGGGFQPQVRFGSDTFVNLGDTIDIVSVFGIGQLALGIPESEFESMEGFEEGANAQFTAIVWDRAGNQTIGSTDNTTLHIDETIPELSGVSVASDNELAPNWATSGNTFSLSYNASEGLTNPTTIILLDTINTTNANNGTEWTGERIVLENDPDGPVPFYITFLDTAGNEGALVLETTDGSIIQIDKTSPEISNLIEGRNETDISYYNENDSLTLYWNHEDALSGIRETHYALGTDTNTADVQPWTSGTNNEFGGWNNLSLSNDTRYFGGAFVRDSAGNYSDTIWGDGIFIDTQFPDTGFIVDGDWIMDMDYAPDSTQLNYRWNNFSDNVGIEYFQLAIGTGEEQINILPFTNIGFKDTVTMTGLNLVRDTLYTTFIKAIDSAGNTSETVQTDGIYFDDTFPVVNKISPDVVLDSAGFLSVLTADTLTIKFNRPIYSYNLEGASKVDSGFQFEHSYSDSIITVIWEDVLVSYDTVTIIIDSATAYNTLVVSDTLIFYSKLWADLNNDYDISVDDILAFNQSWPETDLGPFEGDPPHVRPSPDGEADFTDLTAFAKMWHWKYFSLAFDTTDSARRINSDLDMMVQGDKAEIRIPDETAMLELLIGESNLNVEQMRLLNPTSSAFLFSSMDTNKQMIQFSAADYRGMDSTITLRLPTDGQEIFDATIQFKFKDKNGWTITKGISNVHTEILPNQFAVYPNYPNPFNPVTTIKYELPDLRNVKILVYDLLGRTIFEEHLRNVKPGRHQFNWVGLNQQGKALSSGVYFVQIIAGRDSNIQKVMLLK